MAVQAIPTQGLSEAQAQSGVLKPSTWSVLVDTPGGICLWYTTATLTGAAASQLLFHICEATLGLVWVFFKPTILGKSPLGNNIGQCGHVMSGVISSVPLQSEGCSTWRVLEHVDHSVSSTATQAELFRTPPASMLRR